VKKTLYYILCRLRVRRVQ